MEEATEYKKYLEALRKATEDGKKKPKPVKPVKMSVGGECRGMGIAVKGGKFEGVK
tara:strand:+ start:750 stop:917 length:168 start_codon:yes stop_codon:yes gene_type:complete